jgi:hypothetical protein
VTQSVDAATPVNVNTVEGRRGGEEYSMTATARSERSRCSLEKQYNGSRRGGAAGGIGVACAAGRRKLSGDRRSAQSGDLTGDLSC